MICQKEVQLRPSEVKKYKTCSRECRIKHFTGSNNPRYKKLEGYKYNATGQIILECQNCQAEFTLMPNEVRQKKGKPRFCGRECNVTSEAWLQQVVQASQKRRTGALVSCLNCSQKVYKKSYQIQSGQRLFCGSRCATIYRNSVRDMRRKPTALEQTLALLLDELGVFHRSQERLLGLYVADEYLPAYQVVIEAYGEYWHNLPGRKIRDDERKNRLIANGYSVLEFWEHEFNDLDLVKRKILDAI